MDTLLAETIKLKRSLAWAVVVLLPLTMVLTGTVTTLLDGRPLEDGWHTLWLRVLVFYGLFPLPVGIAILGSLIWQPEHRGGAWNALMAGPTSSAAIVRSKGLLLALLAAVMQAVALVAVVVLGKTVFGLPGWLPGEYLLASGAVVAACVPLAMLQTVLSMLLRSFAAPIAVALLGAGASSVALVVVGGAAAAVSPYAAVGRATQLGTGAFADSGAVDAATVGLLTAVALVMTVVIAALGTLALERRDVRA